MTVCVTCRSGDYRGQFHLHRACLDDDLAFVQTALDKDSLSVGLSEPYLALREAGLVLLDKDVVDALILDHGTDRDADRLGGG